MTEQYRPQVDDQVLLQKVRVALGDSGAHLDSPWTMRPATGGAGASLGVYVVTGTARTRRGITSWSLVLKIYGPVSDITVDTWDDPQREVLACRSGLFSELPEAMRAPRCIAVDEQGDGTIWIWLERIVDASPGPWSPDDHAAVASRLGQFNGAYLDRVPTQRYSWLDHAGLLNLVESAGPAIYALKRLEGKDVHPLIRQFYAPTVVEMLLQLWEERGVYLDALHRLPQTLCHRDAHRRNLFHRTGHDGVKEMVAIDWALAARGAIGEDLAGLVAGNLLLFEAGGMTPSRLDEMCFAAYLEGLRDAGWSGAPRHIRLGYTASLVIQHTLGFNTRPALLLDNPATYPFVEQLFGRPVDVVVKAWADELWPFYVGLVQEARELAYAGL